MKKQPLLLIFMGFLLLGISSAFAQKKDDPTRWTPQDIIDTEMGRSFSFSPDRKMVVWAKRRVAKEKDRFVYDLYLTRLDLQKDGEFRTFQLTRSDDSDYAPFFGSDNETIYFQSSREKGRKLWKLSIFGGEPEEVHEFKNGISSLTYVSDSMLVFAANDGKTLNDLETEESKDDTEVIDDTVAWTRTRLYAFNMGNSQIKRLTNNHFPIGQYAVSRDGKWLATTEILSPDYGVDANPKPKHYLYNLATGAQTEILQGLQTPGGFSFTADHSGFYFAATRSSDPKWNGAGVEELYFFSLASMSYQKVDLQWAWGIGGGYEVVGNDIIVSLANGAVNTLVFYQKNGNSWQKSAIDLGNMNDHVSISTVADAGDKLVFTHSTAMQLPKMYVADLHVNNGKAAFNNAKELVKLNEGLAKKPITKAEVMKWKGWKNEEVTGILYYPENYQAGKRYPLIIAIHGGPSGVDLDEWNESWAYMPNIYAQKGAFVLMPNYHGSSNHGQAFVESIKKNYYEPELEDIAKAIDVLDKGGKVDRQQMGLLGWSNGAILTTMLTVRYPDWFKAAAPGAGDVNWTSDFGTCEFGVSFDQSYFGGAPWDNVKGKTYNETYILKSPLFELEKVKTPTLIFHGSEDRAVPRDQGWEYHRALSQIGQAPVRFLWFPGEPHSLQKITHQLRKMNEELQWFDTYLFKTYKPENETFKEDSPLAALLKKDSLSRHEGLLGVWQNGILAPQVAAVKQDSIAFGVFEVTNAQFQAFDNTHTYAAVAANHPVTGISTERAQAYVQWLADKTWQPFRLPTAAEAKKLHEQAKKAAAKENTLQYWAGYAITPREVPAFQQKLAEVKGSLFKEAGQFAPVKVGEAMLYDLGGNAAERAADGTTYGFSAYDYADPTGEPAKPQPAHVGLRVVLEKR